MNHRISDLLDCLEDAGQDLEPRGGNAARVRARSFAKLHGAQSLSLPPRRRGRAFRVLAAAAAAVTLLCGTAFAAWKLGVFRFAEEFGPAAEPLDAHAQRYEPEHTESIPASFGYASWVKAELGDYNLTLLSLDAGGGSLRATVDVSAAREGVPAFRDSGLSLRFADYETVSSAPRQVEAWKDRVELSAVLPEELADDAEIAFVLSGPGSSTDRAAFRLDALEEAREKMLEADRQHFATAAQTKDYRFSLHSLTASASTVYAVLDVEALTDYGLAHLDEVPEFAVTNRTHMISGTLLDARLLEEGEGQRRYLVGYLASRPENEAGDSIGFEILQLFEEGDLSGHPYYLFDVKLEKLVPDAVTALHPTGTPAGSVTWGCVSVDAIGLSVQGVGEPKDLHQPVVELVFRDGSRETVLDDAWKNGAPRSAHDALLPHFSGEYSGTTPVAHLSLIFSTPLDVSTLAELLVDGQSFRIG